MRRILAVWLALFPALVPASSLPGGLTASDVERVVEIVGVPATARLMRSAESYPSFPGVKVGFEVMMIGDRSLNSLGAGGGTLPSVNPVPRLYLAKGLFMETELVLSFFPTSEVNPVSTIGVALKHCLYQEQDSWLSMALFGAITDVEGFASNYRGTNFELGVLFSRDYVRLKPYLGLGVLAARGEVNASLMAAGATDNDAWITTLHAFLGTEVELPLNFGAQLDLFNLAVGASFFVGKKF